MTNQVTADQIQYLFTFPFQDEGWKSKLLIGFLLTLTGFIIPVLPWVFLAGYYGRLMQAALESGGTPDLPEWDDWGGLFLQGLRLTAAGLVAVLPVLVVFFTGYAAFLAPAFAAELAGPGEGQFSLPVVLAPLFSVPAGMALFGISFLLSLLLGILLAPALGHLVAQGQLGAAFRIREWWPVFQANFAGYMVSYVLILGATTLLYYLVQVLYVSVVLCCLTPVALGLISVYIGMVGGVLFGQTYRVGRERLAEEIEEPDSEDEA